MNSSKAYRLGFIASLALHLLIAYSFKALYPRSYILNILLTSALLGSIMGISAVYGPGKGFGVSTLTYLLYVIYGVYIQEMTFIGSATANLKLFISNSLMSVLVGSFASLLNVGSVLLWSFLSQVLSEVLVNVAEVSTSPIYYVFTMIPYNSPAYVLNSFASLTYSFIYLGLLRVLARERPVKA